MCRHIWMYWEHPPAGRRPPYLDLCLETITRQASGVDLTVVDERSVFDYAPTVSADVWSRLSGPVQRADVARAHLIYQHGGLWMDFDCLALTPLRQLLDDLARAEVAGWGAQGSYDFFIGMFAARPGARFVAAWIREQERRLAGVRDPSELGWSALGADITTPLSQAIDYLRWPTERVAPVHWREWRRFTSRTTSPTAITAHHPVTVMLYNKVMGRYFGSLTRSQLLAQQTLLSRLFRIALGVSRSSDELTPLTWLSPLSNLRFTGPVQRTEHLVRAALGEPDPWR